MQARPRILIIDDDPIAAESLADFLAEEGYDAATACNGQEGLAAMAAAERPSSADQPARPFSLVICDVAMPVMGGLDFLKKAAKQHPATVVVMITGYGSIESAVEAVRLGAADYLTKPVVDAELRIALQRAGRQQALLAENRVLKSRLDDRYGLDRIIGSDHRMLKIYDLVQAVAPSKTTVLMNGESGTGKSLIANAIHHQSPRKDKPFVQLSCGSIPETLLESELFGHVKGAFTGAHVDKVGRFLAADGGTIFLDEINSASPAMQLKLLRVLQERRFEPVGSSQTIEVDVRVVLATNRPLEDLVANGQFRQDLYYRINVVNIDLPPLRERISDIPALADHFLRLHGGNLGRQFAGFAADALDALRRYSYPGNVRELENIVERAAVLSRSPTITAADLPGHVVTNTPRIGVGGQPAARTESADSSPIPIHRAAPTQSQSSAAASLEDALRDPERRIILAALQANGYNRQRTADALKINRTTLYKKMKLLGIDGADDPPERLAG